MAPTRSKAELLAKMNFPPYTVRMLTSRHILIGGGGGKAKTGICNAFEIYELSYDGKCCRVQLCTRYETGDQILLNSAVFHNGKYYVLAAGFEGNCHLYQLKFKLEGQGLNGEVIGDEKNDAVVGLRRRKMNEAGDAISVEKPQTKNANGVKQKSDKNRNSITATIGFCVQPLQCVQTDFSNGDKALQRVVRVSPDLKCLVTGGADGHLRLWQYPSMKEIGCIEAHNDEIDDLDISPNGKYIVSVSRKGPGYVWNFEDQTQVCELQWASPKDEKYRSRFCRFTICEGNKNRPLLFTSHIPLVWQKKPSPCYLVKWEGNLFKPLRKQNVGTEVLTSMATSDDGRFLAVGKLSGDVDIYITFSLQRIVHAPRTHNFFVTALEFVPSVEDGPLVTGDRDASVVSIGVDNQIKILHVSKQETISIFSFLLMFVICLIGVFTLMSYLGF